MDKGNSDHSGSEGEESEKNLWLAALVIGILLLFMLIAIAGIIIWKHFKKENTADQNWAGPSPLTDGNTHEDILSRQRSHSNISTAPIVLNELQAPQKSNVSENTSQGHYKDVNTQDEDDSKTNITPTMPYISSETTSFSSDGSVGQQSKPNPQDYPLNDETSLPPPPDDVLHFPVPSQIDELPVTGDLRDLQPLPLMDVTKSDEHCNQISLYQENTITDSFHRTCDIEDQLLPPPPPDLF
ncbi:protein EVI2B [Rana temporaria]|uniref:protein EVI2B n=1 Tax=Rana temporaria TaxID=8407 RepID=UPI001AAC5342|nr:protein EVI2B [Rana temporaria]